MSTSLDVNAPQPDPEFDPTQGPVASIRPPTDVGGGHHDPDLDAALVPDPMPLAGVDNVWSLSWRVAKHRPKEFWIGWLLFVVFFTMPAISGLPAQPRVRGARTRRHP